MATTEPSARDKAAHRPAVAVVITTFNHAHYLDEALASVLAQSVAADEVIVVDDGSQDDPAAVVAKYPGVQLLRQDNQGLSAARNTGLRAARSEMIVFLDADDRLLPNALAAGLACHERSAGCALVYGGHRIISSDGTPLGGLQYTPIGDDAYHALLHINFIEMHATVMYRRHLLAALGGFDVTLRRCEDYDVYLKIAQRFPMASHPDIVAEYRKHGANMSGNHREMLAWALKVQAAAAQSPRDAPTRRAVREGRVAWRTYYAEQLLADPHLGRLGRLWHGSRAAPRYVAGRVLAKARRTARRALRAGLPSRLRGADRPPGHGMTRFGDLGRTTPIDNDFGYGRGTPVDRFYIETFLQKHHRDIAGRVLEVGDDAYSRRFGAGRVVRQDILHRHAGNPAATLVGDIAVAGTLPRDAFDCIIFTQTLHMVFDMRAGVAELHAALKPGGVLLLTTPGVTPIDRYEWHDTWYWALTPKAAARLLGEAFGADAISVESYGSVFAAICLLHGLAQEEVPRDRLLAHDPCIPAIVAVRAQKPGGPAA